MPAGVGGSETWRSRLNGEERANWFDFDLMARAPRIRHLGVRKHLERPNRRIAAVYFPEGRWRTTIFANGTSQASPSSDR
jgi:hypothetical protein